MAEITGTPEPDSLTGTEAADVIRGFAGDDTIFALGEDDQLEGGDGDDILVGGLGDDVMLGGNGNDTLGIESGQSDQLLGESGHDRLIYYGSETATGADALLDGGIGDDYLFHRQFRTDSLDVATLLGGDGFDRFDTFGGSHITIDAGADADLMKIIDYRTDYDIALGSGSDLLLIESNQGHFPQETAIVVSDFAVGESGDAIDFMSFLAWQLSGWDFAASPFATGHLLVEQRDADAVVRFDRDGAAGSYAFEDLVILRNVAVADLTPHNLGGYAANSSATSALSIDGFSTPDFVTGSSGDDLLHGLGGDDGLFGGAGDDLIEGGDGDDTIDGELGNDILHGGGGGDTISDLIGGGDELYGEGGDDILSIDRQFFPAPDTAFVIDGGAGNDQISFMSGVQKHDAHLIGGAGNDIITAYLGRNVTIDAGDGDDLVNLDLGIGNALVTLGEGTDTVQLTMYIAPVVAFTITDFHPGDDGDKFYLFPVLQSLLDGWDAASNPFAEDFLRVARNGEDTVLLYDSSGAGTAHELLGRLTGVDAGQLTAFNFGYDFGSVASAGTDGSEAIAGTAAADELFGLAGNDILIGRTGEDQLFGGDGVDTASYAGDEGAVFVNLTLGRGYGNASFGDTYDSIENVTGTDYNDFLIGDPGINRLDGGAGNDTIIGAVGPDEIIGGSGLDWASYEDNSGTVFINLTLQKGYNNAAEGDTFATVENLIGGLMDDFFIGDEAANRLNGAMGADTLLGAGGADVFMFTYAPGATSTWGHANADLILDFASGVDTIELAASAFPGLAAGTLPASAFVLGTAAADASDRILYDQATGNLFFDPDGTGGQAATLFATLGETTHPIIAASDFAVV